MAINKQTIEVNIDELVLHGFSAFERYQIAADLQMELTRLFTERGLPASFNNAVRIDSLNAGSFQFSDNKKTSTGLQIAGSVYDSFAVNNKTGSKTKN
jgi:hypothetical protein